MKFFLTACVPLLFLLNNCSAQQAGKPIYVYNLQEDKRIDTVMDMLLKDELKPGVKDSKLQADSCRFLEIFKWNDGKSYSFQIMKNAKSVINYRINTLERNRQKYGFFIYKGNTVFVWSESGFDGFFNTTTDSRTFDFIYYSADVHATHDELYAHVMHYKFSDGHISVEGPPPVAQIK